MNTAQITDPERDRAIAAARATRELNGRWMRIERERLATARLARLNPDGPLGRRILDTMFGLR